MWQRPDRALIKLEWIQRTADHPEKETIQNDGRIRRWAAVPEMDGRYLRVILLPDGETVHRPFLTGDSSHEDQILSTDRQPLHRVQDHERCRDAGPG